MLCSKVFDFPSPKSLAKRLVIGIPTQGCRWWRTGNGCIHCSVGSVLSLHKPFLPPAEIVKQELGRYPGAEFEAICLYTPGSILDSSEVTLKELNSIIELIIDRTIPKRIIIESRPELITLKKLNTIKKLAGNIQIEVFMPLESVFSSTRCLIGKHFNNAKYIEARQMIDICGCEFSSGIIVKPPGLSELEAINDSCRSIEWLQDLNPCRIVVEPIVVYEGTPLESYYRNGKYKPPWLWSVFTIMESVKNMGVEMGGEFLYPIPIARASNCTKCSSQVETMLRNNITDSLNVALQNCPCKEKWLEEVKGN